MIEYFPRLILITALDMVTAVAPHRLGLKPEMTHNRNTAFHQALDNILMPPYAFELDRSGAGAHERLRNFKGSRNSFPECQKRHIGDNTFFPSPTHNRLGVEAHDLQSGLKSRGMSVHHHSRAVTDKERINGALRQQPGKRVIVAGNQRELSALDLGSKKNRDVHGSPHWRQADRCGNDGVKRSLVIAWYLSAVDQVPDLHAPRQWLGRLSLRLSAQYKV